MSKYSGDGYPCCDCGKSFSKPSKLARHRDPCCPSQKYTREGYLQRVCTRDTNMSAVAGTTASSTSEMTPPATGHVCGLCGVRLHRQDLAHHISDTHGIATVIESVTFGSMVEFESWKCGVEKLHKSEFCKSSSSRAGDTTYHYYQCSRSGAPRLKDPDERLRTTSQRGTKKIGFDCTAFITAKEHASHVEARYCLDHYGHATDNMGFVHQKMPQDCLQYLTNLVRSEPDLQSRQILARVKGFMTERQCEVILKNMERVVFLDSTHGVLHGRDVVMLTLMVLNEYGDGEPVVTGLIARENQAHIELLLRAVRRRCEESAVSLGYPDFRWNTRVVMTDAAQAFFNAWCAVHPEAVEQGTKGLICAWHASQAVLRHRSQANDKSRFQQAKQMFYEMQRCTEREHFETLHKDLLKMLQQSGEARLKEYFETYWFRSDDFQKSWAGFARAHESLNTNMRLESYHFVVKRIFMRGVVPKRLDQLLFYWHHIADWYEEKHQFHQTRSMPANFNLAVSHDRHRNAKRFYIDQLAHNPDACRFITAVGNSTWSVRSEVNTLRNYKVVNSGTCHIGCKERCRECGVCTHQMQCNCTDGSVTGYPCKHVHAVQETDVPTADKGASGPPMSIAAANELPNNTKQNQRHLLALTDTLCDQLRHVSTQANERLLKDVSSVVEGALQKVQDIVLQQAAALPPQSTQVDSSLGTAKRKFELQSALPPSKRDADGQNCCSCGLLLGKKAVKWCVSCLQLVHSDCAKIVHGDAYRTASTSGETQYICLQCNTSPQFVVS